MRLADSSVRMMSVEEEGYGADELCFSSVRESIKNILPRCAGKILFTADTASYPAFSDLVRNPRVLAVVGEEDALPLFSMPDGVGAVVGAGGEDTMRTARFFARIRRIPCYLFPRCADLRGVYEREGTVRLGEKSSSMPLAEGEVFCDEGLLRGSVADGYAAVLLARLAQFEERAVQGLHGLPVREREEMPNPPCAYREILLANAALRREESEGSPCGEGIVLAALYRKEGTDLPCWRAYRALTAVYHALFSRGVPRRYFVPDYASRAKRAGVPRWEISVPSMEEYARRAMSLERMRGRFLTETSAAVREIPVHKRALLALTGKEPPAGDSQKLGLLPELCPNGLCAVIRDFGLL